MGRKGEVLIAILNKKRDLRLLQSEGWYRVPVQTAPRNWPPKWIAFYQTKEFDHQKYAVRYYGKVHAIQRVKRFELFPHELPSEKSNKQYFKVMLENVLELPCPIRSKRPRRLVFIETTWEKFCRAQQINDLFNDSPLEDALWNELKKRQIWAERQWMVEVDRKRFHLDFAVFCNNGNLDVETDGETYHVGKVEGQRDRMRNNALTTAGWQILRFSTDEIRESMSNYCVPELQKAINRLGGLQEEPVVPRIFHPTADGPIEQNSLFDRANYDTDSG